MRLLIKKGFVFKERIEVKVRFLVRHIKFHTRAAAAQHQHVKSHLKRVLLKSNISVIKFFNCFINVSRNCKFFDAWIDQNLIFQKKSFIIIKTMFY